jgi:peptidoglycan-N-acetylglucosamine deacetylase
MYPVTFPKWVRCLIPQITWELPEKNKKTIYLTFDDGPTPGITPQVLALLLEYNARATFFCLGHRLEQYPHIAADIRNQGHTLANHGYKHLNGFGLSVKKFTANCERGTELSGSKLFRPAYGHIYPWQFINIRKKNRVVLWSVMSMDFDKNYTPDKCLQVTLSAIKPGAVVVMHDTEKAADRLLFLLPKLLTWLSDNNYTFKALEE